MLKKLSVVICGLGVVLMSAGLATAQTATQETKAKTKSAAHKTSEATKDAADKTGNAMSDAEITTAVKTKLLADKMVGGLKIDVDTSHGVVTLTGPVDSAAERTQAVKLAKGTHGVKSVVSKLTVEAHKK
jgi:hyperosmotically inducible protein